MDEVEREPPPGDPRQAGRQAGRTSACPGLKRGPVEDHFDDLNDGGLGGVVEGQRPEFIWFDRLFIEFGEDSHRIVDHRAVDTVQASVRDPASLQRRPALRPTPARRGSGGPTPTCL